MSHGFLLVDESHLLARQCGKAKLTIVAGLGPKVKKAPGGKARGDLEM
jgi:hypothetical protein